MAHSEAAVVVERGVTQEWEATGCAEDGHPRDAPPAPPPTQPPAVSLLGNLGYYNIMDSYVSYLGCKLLT